MTKVNRIAASAELATCVAPMQLSCRVKLSGLQQSVRTGMPKARAKPKSASLSEPSSSGKAHRAAETVFLKETNWEFPKIRGTLIWGPYNQDPTYLRVPSFRKPPLF